MKESQVTLSARVPAELGQQVDRLAAAIRRNRSWVIEEALRRYIERETQFLDAIEEGIRDIEAGRTIPHNDVMAKLSQRRQQLLDTHVAP